MMALVQSQMQACEFTKTKNQSSEHYPNTTAAKGTTAGLLLELVTVVVQIARLDAMAGKVQSTAPGESSEAEKWHQVSVQALAYSRKALEDEQMSLLRRLSETFGDELPSSLTLPGCLKADEVPGCLQAEEVPVQKAHQFSAPPGLEDQELIDRTEKDVPFSACFGSIPDATPPGLEAVVSTTPAPGRWDCLTATTASTGDGSSFGSPASVSTSPSVTPVVEGSSLRADLEKVKEYTPGSVLIVRKIKALGFESPAMLRTHFSQYGTIADVLVAHSSSKPSAKRLNGRTRPAALGFVVMGSTEEAEVALAAGMNQGIKSTDVEIEVQLFQGQSPN